MKILFSASTLGFYLEGIHSAIPEDAVEVSEAERAAALAVSAAPDKELAAGTDGKPIIVDRAISSAEAMNSLRARRDRLLSLTDKTQIADFPIDSAQRSAWADYRAALRDLPETYASDPASVVWPAPPTEGLI